MIYGSTLFHAILPNVGYIDFIVSGDSENVDVHTQNLIRSSSFKTIWVPPSLGITKMVN